MIRTAICVGSIMIKLTWFYTCVWKVKCAGSMLACASAVVRGLANTSLLELVSTVGLSVLDLIFCFWPPIFIVKAILLIMYLKDLPRFAQAIDVFILAFQALYLWHEYQGRADPRVANRQQPPAYRGDDDDDHGDNAPQFKKQLDSIQKSHEALAKQVAKLVGQDQANNAQRTPSGPLGTANNPIVISANPTTESLVTGGNVCDAPLPIRSSPTPAGSVRFEGPNVFRGPYITVWYRLVRRLTVVSPIRTVRIIRS
jgi:hypothetical protein